MKLLHLGLIAGGILLLSKFSSANNISQTVTPSPVQNAIETIVATPTKPTATRKSIAHPRGIPSHGSSGSWSNDSESRTWSAPDAGTSVSPNVLQQYMVEGATVHINADDSAEVITASGSRIYYS